jgi:hypothetical protein
VHKVLVSVFFIKNMLAYRGRMLSVEEVNSVQKVVVSVRDQSLGLAWEYHYVHLFRLGVSAFRV